MELPLNAFLVDAELHHVCNQVDLARMALCERHDGDEQGQEE